MGGDFIFVDSLVPSSLPSPIQFLKTVPAQSPLSPTRGTNYIKEANRYKEIGDIQKAMQLYRKACDLKNSLGCVGAGVLYQKQNDNPNTIKFLTKACAYGHQRSCRMIGD